MEHCGIPPKKIIFHLMLDSIWYIVGCSFFNQSHALERTRKTGEQLCTEDQRNILDSRIMLVSHH